MSQDPSFQDPFEFLRKLWSPMGLPMPGMVVPTMDVGELDKRIADLKSVEAWLNTNLSMLRMSIQGLEMQKATLSAFNAMHAAAQPASAKDGAPPSAAEVWWNMFQQHQAAAAPKKDDEKDK